MNRHIVIRGTIETVPPETREEAPPFGTSESPQIVPDGSGVYWPSLPPERFYFNTATQRRIILELWQARERGRPCVNQDALLSLAGSKSRRLVQEFEQHPAWGVLIVRGKLAGTYSLPA